MLDREKLIEEAAKAIVEVKYPEIAWGLLSEERKTFRRRQARAALAVFEKRWSHTQTVNIDRAEWERLKAFEKAHTPTDHERKEIKTALNYLDELIEVFSHRVDVQRVLRWVIERLRIPVVPEPSAERCYWCNQPARGAAVWQGDGDRYASCGQEGHGALFAPASPEPQYEPSDAQAEAEANRRWPHTPGEPETASARSARRLSFRQGVTWARAASAVTEQAEKT